MDKRLHEDRKAAVRRQELRRSGAAGSHGDRRTKRVRTRANQKRAALREYGRGA